MKQFSLFLFAFLFLSFSSNSQNVGDKAPDIVLQQLQGGNFTLSQNTGKVVFIFWLGNNCSFCKSVAPTISSEIINSFGARTDFTAIGIDTWNGSSSLVSSFKAQTGLDVNYLMQGSSTAQNWNTTYDRLSVVDKSGKIVFKGTAGASTDVLNAKVAIDAALKVITSASVQKENSNQLLVYPNPFSDQATISFKLEKSSFVVLDLIDLTGKQVKVFTKQRYPSGEFNVRFSKAEFRNGIYFLRLSTNENTFTRKVNIQ